MNWGRWSKWCFIGALGMLVWLLWPAARCTLKGMDETELVMLDDEEGDVRRSDLDRLGESASFADRFFGNLGICYERHTIAAQKEWKRRAGGWLAVGWIGFFLIGWAVQPRARLS